jgi:MFS superfamily sulfate permease-like transporter
MPDDFSFAMIRNALAGFSVAGLLLPSAIAYAAIAGLSPDHAIVATLVGLAVYAVLGRSRFAMVAPTSSSAAILAALVISTHANGLQNAEVADAAVLAAGFCFLVAAAARAGALSNFISRPVLQGFTLGIAITITAKQLPAISGISGGGLSVLPLLWHLLTRLPQSNPASVIIGTAALGALLILQRSRGVPAAALTLMAGVLLSRCVNLPALHVALVGKILLTLPHPAWPRLSMDQWTRVLELALPLFLILFAESWSSIRGPALRHGDTVVANRELVALGCANVASGLLQGMPVGAGFSASSAAETAGAQNRLAGVTAMAVLLALVIWGRPEVALLPAPVLAAVVIASLFHALNPAPLLRLWRIRRDEYVATVAVVAVIFLGVLDGMLAAVGLSLLALVQRMAGTQLTRLGQIHATHDFVSLERYSGAETDPQILILRPAEPLFFANAERVLTLVSGQAAAEAVAVVILSLEESPDLDSTALDALMECDSKLTRLGRRLLLARTRDDIRDALRALGAEQLAGDGRCFHSVADAFASAILYNASAPPGTR